MSGSAIQRLLLIVLAVGIPCSPTASSHVSFVETDATGSTAKLYIVDPDNPIPRLLLDMSQDAFGMIRDPELSPDGNWIAFSCEKDLMNTPWRSNAWIIDRYGQNLSCITHKTPDSFPPGLPTGSVEGIVYEDGLPKSGAWVYISSITESATSDINGHYRFDDVPVGSQYITAYDPNILYDDEDFGFMPVEIITNFTSPGDVTLTWDWDNQQGANDLAWSTNGQQVLFVDNAGGSNRINLDGSGLSEVAPLPPGVTQFDDIAVRPTNGDVAYLTYVFYGDESLKGVWISNAGGGNMRQVVSDASYAMSSLHWSSDGSLFGYSTTVTDQYGNAVDGVVFYTDQGQFINGIALDQGYYGEFGGWDPSMQYVCLNMWPSGQFEQAILYSVRLSDYATAQLFGPGNVSFPSWGPDAANVWEDAVGNPEELVLGPAFPNPSRGSVVIRINSDVYPGMDSPLRLGIFDIGGHLLSDMPVTSKGVVWNGRDDSGRPVPGGTYFVRLMGPTPAVQTVPVVLLR